MKHEPASMFRQHDDSTGLFIGVRNVLIVEAAIVLVILWWEMLA